MDVILINLICAMAPSCLYVQGEGCATPFQVVDIDFEKSCVILKHKTKGKCDGIGCLGFEDEIKPYLRPMSSMTEEEKKEFQACHCVYELHPDFQPMMCNLSNELNMFDWLNAHHFDYRGLIEKGLALEAPSNMYNIK